MLNTWPIFSEEEVLAAQKVLQSGKVNYWTGEEGRSFEKEFAEYCNTEYAIAVSNGTVALEYALRALNIGQGDEVIVSPRTFLASASSIVMVGAIPIFAEVDKVSQNITAKSIEEKITRNTKAIIAVHLAGWPCDMDSIKHVADTYSLKIIEDCAQAHGAKYKGRNVGSLGDVAAWSFCQDKIMSTGGEGGMLTTNNKMIWEKIWSMKDHGKSWDSVYNKEHKMGFRWVHDSFGTNGRMTEVQAAIGRIQLTKLHKWHQQRTENAEVLSKIFKGFSDLVDIPEAPSNIEHAWYKYYIFVKDSGMRDGWNRDRVMTEINEAGIPCFSGSCSEVYLEKAFSKNGYNVERLPVAKELGEKSLMFQIHPTLTSDDLQKMCAVITSVLQKAKKDSTQEEM